LPSLSHHHFSFVFVIISTSQVQLTLLISKSEPHGLNSPSPPFIGEPTFHRVVFAFTFFFSVAALAIFFKGVKNDGY
jgi:hypothetical protein